jgi:ABC transport system ATP-binding/permease protein
MSPIPLLSCEAIGKAYGADPLFEGVSLCLCEGDRVGLVGPNGSGKTTLLKILAGIEGPDSGTRAQRKLLRLGYVPQDPSFAAEPTVEQVVAEALLPARLEEAETLGRVAAALGRAGFVDPEQPVGTLSAGWRKRLAIARELAKTPDVLLMDEPTNHLDLEGIFWLEALLANEVPAYLVVSHDRYFLEHVTARMLELNRCYPGGMFAAEGSYSSFLLAREQFAVLQATEQVTLANKVRREVDWLHHGAKARTRKSSARIKAAGQLMDELDEVRSRTKTAAVGIDFTATDRKSKKLLTAAGLGKTFEGRPVLSGIGLTLAPGTRLGLVGPSGSGKSTLLHLLAGTLAPDAGRIERADGLRVIAFDQERVELGATLPLRRALAPEGDSVVFQDRPVHVSSWARRFLFRPEQLEVAVGRLSGGERARIAIARLMLQPADVLLLDEPTNDLDIPTLEVLEDNLADFPGALVLVTRDRFLLDRLATTVLALDRDGRGTFFADYAQWELARDEATRTARAARAASGAEGTSPKGTGAGEGKEVKRLGYLEKREWEAMEQRILEAEAALAAAAEAMDDPTVAADSSALASRYAALCAARAEVDRLYARWAELEVKQGPS